MRWFFRYRIATLLLATTLIAVATHYVNWRYFTPAGIYQTTKNGSALLGILGVEIRNGDTLASVRKRLGSGFKVTDKKSLERIRTAIESQPSVATDGYRDTDAIVAYYSVEGFVVELQFRDQILVNFQIPEAMKSIMIKHYEKCTQTAK